jgi:DNA-binding NarL/FixJ family response regulator
VANRLREARPGLRTLFVSGYTDDAILRHGVAAGRDPFLAKPFTPEQLTRSVRDVLDDAHPPTSAAPNT